MSEIFASLSPEIQALFASLQATIENLNQTIEHLRSENAELKRLIFGQRRERVVMPTPARELKKKKPLSPEDKIRRDVAARQKRSARRKRRKELPVVSVHHRVSHCPDCLREDLEDIKSPEISEEIEFVPAHFIRKEHLREKKKCPQCKTLITAPAPKRVSDGCHYGPGFHAHLAVSKCADAIPLHRLSKRFARDGVVIERSTLNRLFHRTAFLMRPVAQRILELVAESQHINADETPILIQAPEKCDRGYVWTFLSGNLVAYVFSASRSGSTPENILSGTKGTLQVDGYTGYNIVCVPEKRKRIGCLAHARRYFFIAKESAPVDGNLAVQKILSLYEVEYEAASQGVLGTAKHLALRKTLTRERLDDMMAWMAERQPHYPPQSPMGKALKYAIKMWPSLDAVCDDVKIRLDNNLAENALRIIALGRKNFLFVGDEEGGENLATLQTIVSTCQASGVNPEDYIADVLLRLDDTPSSEIDLLLPMNWKPAGKHTQSSGEIQ